MDNGQFEKIMRGTDAPPADENARKRALNLALAEFESVQQEKKNNPQGSSLFSRLTGSSNKDTRKTAMNNKRLVYGGTVTAMALVLAMGVTLTHMGTAPAPVSAQFTNNVALGNTGARHSNDFSSIASNITTGSSWFGGLQKNSAPESKVADMKEKGQELASTESYKKSEREANAPMAEEALKQKSALPGPAGTPAEKTPVMDAGAANGAAAQRVESESDVRRQPEQYADTSAPPAPPAASAPMETKSLARSRADLMAEPRDKEVDRIAGKATGMIMPAKPAPIYVPTPASPPVVAMNDEVLQQSYDKDVGRDKFEHTEDNPPKVVTAEPVSTFSADVDTSSYSFMRRQINEGVLPQKDAVRIEEMVNYFDYDYPVPEAKTQPFQPAVAVEPCPWKKGDKLIHIGIKGYDIPANEHPHSNLVFLLDTSGSMSPPDRLALVVQSMKLLLDQLQPDDTVAIVTYAGNAGTALEPTAVRDKDKILSALDNLNAGGSTAGAEGIRQAYNLAEAHFDKKSVNRVILATDGDFNVGITDPNELKSFIERERDTGIFLSVLAVGEGNLNDQLMQDLAQNGNGVAAYIDNLNEARKVLVKESTSTLFPIAKDVKIQVEFNPATVSEYRLIGYETRHLNREDFNNDKVDAGDVGAGHAVTALYEITPAGSENRLVDDSRYQKEAAPAPVRASKSDSEFGSEYAFLKIRYKLPDENTSKLITTPITKADEVTGDEKSGWKSTEPGWAAAVAGFGQVLRGGKYTGDFNYDDVITLAQANKGKDEYGYRSEFIQLVRLAKSAARLQKN